MIMELETNNSGGPILQSCKEIEVLFADSRIESLGFSTKRTGGHMSRSMMLTELSIVFGALPAGTRKDEYKLAVTENNLLGKPTQSSRQKSFRHLVELYGMDPQMILFHSLRTFAAEDPETLALLALVCSYCRDPQLRQSYSLIDSMNSGEEITRVRMEEHLESCFPGRFSDATKKSLAQNVNTSWGGAGHLTGKARKYRAIPNSNMWATVFATFAGYLLGLRGDLLLQSVFLRLVRADYSTALSHLSVASSRGWLRFRHGGGVTEIDFDPLIQRHEQEMANGPR